MIETRIELTAIAGCWHHQVFVDDQLFVSRVGYCFTNPQSALKQALADMQQMHRANQREAKK